MAYIFDTPNSGEWLYGGCGYAHISDPQTTANLIAAGVAKVVIDDGTHQNLVAAQTAKAHGSVSLTF